MRIIAFVMIISIFSFSGCRSSSDQKANTNNSSTQASADHKPAPEPVEVREPSTRFANLKVFAARLQNIDRLILFEGLPHQMFALKLYQEELANKKTVSFHGFPFYEETLDLREADSTELTQVFRDRKSFKRHWGPKACGGFHPDYCLEWHVGQEVYRALVCFGCNEVMLFGPNVELYCDMSYEAAGKLWGLLEPYNKNRPGPRRH